MRMLSALVSLLLTMALCAASTAWGQVVLTPEEMFDTNVIRFQDPDNALGGRVPVIQEILASTLRRTITALPITAVTITVMPDPKRTIPGYGVGGYTPHANAVSIFLDPMFADWEQVLSNHLPQTLVHELHHCMRWRGPGYGRTLFEAM